MLSWFATRKHIVGVGVGVVSGVAAYAVVASTNSLWWVLAPLGYVLGAVLTPAGRAPLALGVSAQPPSAEKLLARYRAITPPAHVDQAWRQLGVTLAEILAKWDELVAADVWIAREVTGIVTEHAPEVLATFQQLPQSVRTDALRDKVTRSVELFQQRLTEIRDAAYADDIASLSACTEYLESKYRKSSLDFGAGPT